MTNAPVEGTEALPASVETRTGQLGSTPALARPATANAPQLRPHRHDGDDLAARVIAARYGLEPHVAHLVVELSGLAAGAD
jgi:hypothetical protein